MTTYWWARRWPTLGLLALLVLGCDSAPRPTETVHQGGPKADSVDEYSSVSLSCEREVVVEASLEDGSVWSDPFDAGVRTRDDELTLEGDFVRVAALDDDGLWLEMDEYTLAADALFLLFVRELGSDETYRPVAVPLSATIPARCDPKEPAREDAEPCVLDPATGVSARRVRIDDMVPYLHWVSIARAFDPERHAPRNNPALESLAEFLGIDPASVAGRELVFSEDALDKDGLLFWGVPRDWEERYVPRFGGEVPTAFASYAFFAPFDEVPALKGLTGSEVEWGLFGIPRAWGLGDFEPDWIGSFDYDLVAHCPGIGCEGLTPTTEPNCGLPLAWEP